MTQVISNRYQLLDKLGQGGMGVVHKAFDRLTGETIALKQVIVAPGDLQFTTISTDSDGALALALEFRLLASLRHPHIVAVLDYGFDGPRQPFYTMQLIEDAQTLLDYGKTRNTTEKVHLLVETLQALTYLHRRGIIHRDLKPGNVLVTGNKTVKVMDFGLALDRGPSMSEDSIGGVVGTLAYMAPELFTEESASVQSDLYAVGVMAYELFIGQHPFNMKDVTMLLSSIMRSTPDTTTLEIELAEVIDRLLAKTPGARYANAQDAITALCEATGQALPVESTPLRESFLQASAFVGRDGELEKLKAVLTGAVAGKGASWLVGGESGIGKSRLLDELRTRAVVGGALVLRGQAVAEGGLPYQLWREVVRRLVLSADLSDLEVTVLKTIVPDIATLLEREAADAPQLDAQATVQRLSLTIMDMFKRQTQPVVLILEDLHWTSESLEPLKQLNLFVSEYPWLIVGSYRDDEMPDLPERLPGMQVMKLPRLSDAAIADLSAGMLGDAGKQTEILQLLKRETEGNAFFMVEVVRALAEEAGALSAIGQVILPQSIMTGGVQAVVHRRLRRVPDWAQDALKIAAVAGRQLDLKVLQSALPSIDWEDWLTVCAEAAVLDVVDGMWRFSHDKLREALLADLTDSDRPALFRAVAEALEAAYPGDETQADRLVEYWHGAGNPAKTLEYTRQSVERLVNITADYNHALGMIERGLRLTDTPAMAHHRPHLRASLGDIQERLGRYDEAREQYEASLGEAGDLAELQAWILNGLGKIDWRQGRYAESLRHAQRALDIATAAGDNRNRAVSLNNLGNVADDQGNVPQARALYEESLSIRREIGDRRGIAASLNNLGIIASDQGDFAEAHVRYKESLSIRREIGDRRGIAASLNNLGVMASAQTNFMEARALYEESLHIYREIGDRQGIANNLINLGFANLKSHRVDAARAAWQESLIISREMDETDLALEVIVGVAQIRFNSGDPEQAAGLAGLVASHPAASAETKHIYLAPLLSDLRAALGAEALDVALAHGASLDLDTVIAGVLLELARNTGN